MSHGKMTDFVSVTLFGFTFVIKLRNFNFESHRNVLIFFDKKKICCQILICSTEKYLIWFYFHCLGSL